SPAVGTTGPSTLNPGTGKPYGSAFPVVSMRDFVRAHKALIDSLGVKKLKAVAGASGGAIQAMEWGAAYPELVERVIHVIGPGLDIHPYVIAMLDAWVAPIKLDPNWKGGDYHGGPEPAAGLAQSLKLVTLTTVHFAWAEKLRAQGNYVELYEIDGTSGHLDGLFSIGKVADQIRAFMEK